MPRGCQPPFRLRPGQRPRTWRVIGRLHGCRQLASKEGRLCCRNRGRAWRSRSAAARRRCGTEPRLAARGLGALAVIPSRPAAGACPLRWPRSSAPPGGRAWPWPPPARGSRDSAARARAGGRGRFRGRHARVRGLPVDRHHAATGRAAAGRSAPLPAAARQDRNQPLAARGRADSRADWGDVASEGSRPAADAYRRRPETAAAAPGRKARCSIRREHAGYWQASRSPAHHAGLAGLVGGPRNDRPWHPKLSSGLTDDEPPQRCLAAAIWIPAKSRQFPVAIFGVIGQNSTRCVSRRAARQIDHKVRVLRHQLIVRARRDGSITLTESRPRAQGTRWPRALVNVREGNGDVGEQVARRYAVLSGHRPRGG